MAGITLAVSTTSTAGANSYTSASFSPATGDLLVVFVAATGASDVGITCTESVGDVTFTRAVNATKSAGGDLLICFVANALMPSIGGGPPNSRSITFSKTSVAANGAVITVYRISGMSRLGAGAIRQSAVQINQVGPATPAVTFAAACLTSNPTLGFFVNGANPATMTPPTNWTEDSDNGYASPITGQEAISRVSGFTGTTVTWGSSSATNFGDIMVELDASSLQIEEDGQPTSMKPTPFDPQITVWQ